MALSSVTDNVLIGHVPGMCTAWLKQLRRRANIEPTLGQRLVCAGY